MNSKALKLLRKSIRKVAGRTHGMPLRGYLPFVPRFVTVPSLGLNSDGTQLPAQRVHAGFMPIRNDPQSQRGIYRAMKASFA